MFAHMLEEFRLSDKILSMTCDNASNNDAMIDELETCISAFQGFQSHTQCFLHVMNLITKSLIWQFDVGKKEADCALEQNQSTIVSALVKELEGLSSGINEEEAAMNLDEDDGLEDAEGWVNKVEEMHDDACAEHAASILPVKLALVKVSRWVCNQIPLWLTSNGVC